MQAATIIIDTVPQLDAQMYTATSAKQTGTSGNNGFSFLDQLKKELNKEEPIKTTSSESSQKNAVVQDKQYAKAEKTTESAAQAPEEDGESKTIVSVGDEQNVEAQQTLPSDKAVFVKQMSQDQTNGKTSLTSRLKQNPQKEIAQKDSTNNQEDVRILALQQSAREMQQATPVEKNTVQQVASENTDVDVLSSSKAHANIDQELLIKNTSDSVDTDSLELDNLNLEARIASQFTVDNGETDTASDKQQDDGSKKQVQALTKNTKSKDPVFTVTDLRTEQTTITEENTKQSVKSDFVTSVSKTSDTEVQMTLNLTNDIQQNITASNDQSASATGSTFQSMLSNQLQHNASDIVKAGSIVLRDNNIGNINLILHPESLGNVKINLQLTDKIIAGHITVASKEAFAAFQENIGSLKEAFAQNGFENASFDLSWSGQQGNMSFTGNDNQNANSFLMQRQSNQTYGDYAVANADEETTVVPQKSGYAIDVSA